jgi:hypothetical protein
MGERPDREWGWDAQFLGLVLLIAWLGFVYLLFKPHVAALVAA